VSNPAMKDNFVKSDVSYNVLSNGVRWL